MVVLLTGANGMLARALSAHVPPGVKLVGLRRGELDITDVSQVSRAVDALKPQIIVNAAAYTAVDRAERDEGAAQRVNGAGPAVLGAACARTGAKLIHFSTDHVFDGTRRMPYDEDAPTSPVNAYGRSKLAGETAVRASGARHLIIRTQWLFGPGGKSFPATMWQRARDGVATRVVDDQAGSPTATDDLARVTWRLLDRDGIIHAVSEGSASRYDVARHVFSLSGAAHLVSRAHSSEFPDAAPRPTHVRLATARLLAAGARLPAWTESLDRFVASLRAANDRGPSA